MIIWKIEWGGHLNSFFTKKVSSICETELSCWRLLYAQQGVCLCGSCTLNTGNSAKQPLYPHRAHLQMTPRVPSSSRKHCVLLMHYLV